jgi:hypothetical protein
MVSLACAGIVVALLITAVVATHLLANREMVKSFIIGKTAQATGGKLVYDRLDVGFLPLPHLKAREIHLHRQDAFEVTAKELSVYPRLLSLLKGQVSIRRFALIDPDVKVLMGSDPIKTPDSPKTKSDGFLEDGIKTAIGSLFDALAAVDPGTDLRIEDGTVSLAFTDAPDLQISGIQAAVENDDGNLSLSLQCRSDLTGNLKASANADVEAMQAKGHVSFSAINVRPVLSHATLPGGITTDDTLATVNADVTIAGPETVHGRFDLQIPSLTVMRKGLKLDLDTVAGAGTADYSGKHLSVSIETLRSAEPALDLSAVATIQAVDTAGRSVMEVHAAAKGLDVAVAGAVTRAIAGDLDEIRTAFSVARQGQLTEATYFAGFDIDATGWHLNKMKASGHLSQGLVTIPGIDADLERMDGDVIYEDRHVAFDTVSGNFKGAAFSNLDAAIDWEKESTLNISTPSVTVDAQPFFTWLTSFQGLDTAKNYIQEVSGTIAVSKLQIRGPLTKPAEWSFEISGAPEAIRLNSPLVPFEVRLSGGELTYIPGKERATGVKIKFLDGSFVSSYQSKGIVDPESAALRIDGSMGQATIEWLNTLLPIPRHLQMKPPVELSGVHVGWSDTRKFAFTGGMKTAGGVDLFADFSISPQDWNIRRVQFADGSSRVTASARKDADGIHVGFLGNVEKSTADRLLENNQTLSGRLEGDFRARIDIRSPLKSSFSGKLAGEGVHILTLIADPIDIKQFAIEGDGGQLKIAPSVVSLCDSLLVVDGEVDASGGSLVFDINADADRLDEEFIRAIISTDKKKAGEAGKPDSLSATAPRGTIHVRAADFSYGGFNWSPVQADVHVDGDNTQVQIDQADLCGIATTGALGFSPRGVSLHIVPTATDASFQETVTCLWHRQVKAAAQYDLTGEINLPPTRENLVRSMSGHMEFSSDKGRIAYSSVLMKIFSVLNITEVFTGGQSDLTEEGFGYSKAYTKAEIKEGKIQFTEILLDGNSLKITGQGDIALDTREADIRLLAAPLKTIDRMIDKIPIVNYIAGGSLISIPLRITGPLADIKVSPMSPSAVGEGLLKIMERTLKAPFKMVRSASEFAVEESSREILQAAEPPADAP